MSETRGPANVGRDALGILLIAVAVLSGVSVVMTLVRPVAENPSGLTAMFTGLVDAVGPIAGLFAALGLFVVGVRLWLAGASERIGRDLLGVVLVTLALSILVGSLSPDLAGRLGNGLGGAVSRRLTVFVGLPFGLVCVLLPTWLLWLRGRSFSRNLAASSHSPTLRQTPTTGVSAASPAASAPDAPPRRLGFSGPAGLPADVVKAETKLKQPASAPSAVAPYPVTQPQGDVRVHGGIPAGAQPLATIHVQPHHPSPPRAAALSHGGAVDRGGAVEPARAHLAAADDPAVAELAVVRDEPRVATFDADVDEPELVGHASAAPAATESELTPAAVAAGEVGGAPSALDAEPEFAAGLEEEVREEELTLAGPPPVAPSADNLISDGVEPISARPPQPSWEQPGLFDEEPVDAYGTPLSLVDALRKANEDTAERLGEPVEPAPEPEPEVAATAQNGLFDEPAAAPAPAVAEDDTADDDQSEEDDEDDEPAGSDELDAEDDLDALAEDDDAPLASKPAAEEPLPAVVLQPRAAPAPEPHPEPAALAEDDAPEAVEEPETVRHVVSEGSSSEDVVYRAGCLFLERGRVAVSMLQREFGLDFKAATEVLDELQKAGLIGPYLGGQRRDILLTREQWDQRVGAA